MGVRPPKRYWTSISGYQALISRHGGCARGFHGLVVSILLGGSGSDFMALVRFVVNTLNHESCGTSTSFTSSCLHSDSRAALWVLAGITLGFRLGV